MPGLDCTRCHDIVVAPFTKDGTMNAASRRKALRLNQQAARLMTAAPQVVAHRLTRMALAGPQPNASDQREFHLMRAEKLAAFGESWQAMGLQMWKSQAQLATSMMQGWGAGASGRAALPPLGPFAAACQAATLDILSEGLRPVQRRASANAQRLRRRRSR